MTKMYFSDTYGLHSQFLVHSNPNPWNFLRDKSNGSTFVRIFVLLSLVPENFMASEP